MTVKTKKLTPVMGWNSYCNCDCSPSEKIITDAADALVRLGLSDLGYNMVGLDDGYLGRERNAEGQLVWKEDIFPHGMKWLTDYIHSKGLLAGCYLGCGLTTWWGDAGTLGHEFEDAKRIAEWGFDLVKYDNHPTDQDGERNLVKEYIKMGIALKNCGRDIIFAMCEHGATRPWLWAHGVGDMWRVGGDIRDNFSRETDQYRGILGAMDEYGSDSTPHTRVGGISDPDFLVVGIKGNSQFMELGNGLTDAEGRTQFALWCMTSSPLIIGADLNKLDEESLRTLKNKNLIAIDQDPLVIPARRVSSEYHGRELWVKEMSDFRWAVAVLNRGPNPNRFSFRWEEVGLAGGIGMTVRDEWTGEEFPEQFGVFSCDVASHDTRVFTLTPEM
ncbi:MAG: glycoside hydrolase family 27 protein [Clostridia bacterium]|nr:glycoside hydrolase family 27 protein [Clostridia bacterium]